MSKVYYFGCVERAGHYMWNPPLDSAQWPYRYDSDFFYNNPWGYEVDGRLCPSGPEIEGSALIHHKDGWTALAFWDRSIDKRGKCNSVFLAEGDFSFKDMVEIGRRHFSRVVNRFTFEISEAGK